MKHYTIKRKGRDAYAPKSYTSLSIMTDENIAARMHPSEGRYQQVSVDDAIYAQHMVNRLRAKEWTDPVVIAKYIEKLRNDQNGGTFSEFEVEIYEGGSVTCVPFDTFAPQYYVPKAKPTPRAKKFSTTEEKVGFPTTLQGQMAAAMAGITPEMEQTLTDLTKTIEGADAIAIGQLTNPNAATWDADYKKLQQANKDGEKLVGQLLKQMGF